MTSLQDLSEAYFRSMNSLAEKISNDLLSTQDAYQDLWYKLSNEEQKQVLNEAVIDPAAVLKYNRLPEQHHTTWTETPSSDFSWFTKSQLNLFTVSTLRGENLKTPIKKCESYNPSAICSPETSTFSDNKVKNQNDINLFNKLRNKVTVLKTSTNEERQSLVESKTQVNLTPKMIISKPKTPPPPPPAKPKPNIAVTEKKALLSNDNESDLSEDIPKTGFDFLDNW